MSENKHTPEPWRTDAECGFPQDIHDSKGNLFLRCGSDFDNEIYGEANARRIVACVNACAGISQQYLEELNGETLADKQMVLITQRDEYSLLAYRRQNILDEVIKQRDELLAAMIHIQQVACSGSPELGIAIDAIASVKGKQ